MAVTNQNTASIDVEAAMAAYKSTVGVEKIYQVVLDVRGDESLDSSGRRIFPIIANLPERFNLQFSSNWSTPLSGSDFAEWTGNALQSSGAERALRAITGAIGISTKLRSQSMNVWESSSPLQFSIDMIFNAFNNTLADVQDKHKAILKLAAPSMGEDRQLLRAPGPTVIDEALGGRSITLWIGNYLRIKNVIINSVSSDVESQFDANGIPISLAINIGVQSFYSDFTTVDIEEMFVNG
jgi:hypothetical protein